MPKLPNAFQQDEVRVACDRKIAEVGKCLRPPLSRDLARDLKAPQDLCDFEIDQMRSVQGFAANEEDLAHSLSRWRLQQNFNNCGGVDDDQRRFLSARTAAAAEMRLRTG